MSDTVGIGLFKSNPFFFSPCSSAAVNLMPEAIAVHQVVASLFPCTITFSSRPYGEGTKPGECRLTSSFYLFYFYFLKT